MSCAVIGGLRGRNSDVAIVSIEPLPAEEVCFTSIRDMIEDFWLIIGGLVLELFSLVLMARPMSD